MKKKYEVAFMYQQLSEGTAIIEAENQDEAEQIAEEMGAEDDRITFEAKDGELTVEGVSEIEESTK